MTLEYAEEPCAFNFARKAGAGFVSDGVPEPIGDKGESERLMPGPIGTKLAEITKPYRKVRS